jgi:GNAT superfamily N-acetyltransferase
MRDTIEPGSSTQSVPPPTVFAVGRAALCREALESLPEWFGRPASVEAYVAAAETLPMPARFAPSGMIAGFLSLKIHTPAATEIDVMGVEPAWHRRGVGRALVEAAPAEARARGAGFLKVKTLARPARIGTTRIRGASPRRPVSCRSKFFRHSGAQIPCLFMARSLVTPTKASTFQAMTN